MGLQRHILLKLWFFSFSIHKASFLHIPWCIFLFYEVAYQNTRQDKLGSFTQAAFHTKYLFTAEICHKKRKAAYLVDFSWWRRPQASTSQTPCRGRAGWRSAARCHPHWSSWAGWGGSAEPWRRRARPSTATTSPRPPENQRGTFCNLGFPLIAPQVDIANVTILHLRYLLVSGLGLQDVLFPDGVEHAALPAEVSEALFLVVPAHLQGGKHTGRLFNSLRVMWAALGENQSEAQLTSVARRRMNMGRPSMMGAYLSSSKGRPVRFPSCHAKQQTTLKKNSSDIILIIHNYLI